MKTATRIGLYSPLNHSWNRKTIFGLSFIAILFLLSSCSIIKVSYKVTKGTVKGSIWTVKKSYKITAGTTKVIYKIGEFTFEVVKAPLEWPLTHKEIEAIDGLPPKEAIRQDRVKNSPYTVNGRTYYPMSVEESKSYEEIGVASWYGYETLHQEGGNMTANGEAFSPRELTAAHKYLPLPMYARVTNLKNDRAIIVRVNDRGPFPSKNNPRSGDRIIDLSEGAARRLGFYEDGLTMVKVEAIEIREE